YDGPRAVNFRVSLHVRADPKNYRRKGRSGGKLCGLVRERPAASPRLLISFLLLLNFNSLLGRSCPHLRYLRPCEVVAAGDRISGGAAEGDSLTPRIAASVGEICVMRITPMEPRLDTVGPDRMNDE